MSSSTTANNDTNTQLTSNHKRLKTKKPIQIIPPTSPFPNFQDFVNLYDTTNTGTRTRPSTLTSSSRSQKSLQDEDAQDLHILKKEIVNFASTHVSASKQSKKIQAKRNYTEFTGMAPPKYHPQPINILRKIKQKYRQREQRKRQELKESGVVTWDGNQREQREVKERKKYRDKKGLERRMGPSPGVGVMKGGILHANKNMRR